VPLTFPLNLETENISGSGELFSMRLLIICSDQAEIFALPLLMNDQSCTFPHPTIFDVVLIVSDASLRSSHNTES
jgi:hypothetical protein